MKQSLSANTRHGPRERQQGAALITALIFLIIITVIALSSMRSSTQELRMAVNAEEKLTAGQLAQAVADALWTNANATPVIGEVGRRICTANFTGGPACDDLSLVLPGDVAVMIPAAGQASVAVERLNPETRPCPGFTMAGAGAGGFGCAAFRVHARYDGTAARGGRADVYEGVLVQVTSN
jgi:Tfp pilus assembly protein PilV